MATEYQALPSISNRPIILVPKYSVRRAMCLNSQEYYSHHILNFIQDEELERGSSLVRVLKNGERRPPFKKDLKDKFPFTKDFLARFSEANPGVLKGYKEYYRKLSGADGVLSHDDFQDSFEEALFAKAIVDRLRSILPGKTDASEYHKFIVGALEFVFWPHLIYPRVEDPIHEGRKRIDITYTNAARDGFFYRIHTAHNIGSNFVMVECKNYSEDPANPEVDQLLGRFSTNLGRLGLLLYRTASDHGKLLLRCRDAAQAGQGVVIPIGDEQLIAFLDAISDGKRQSIDLMLEEILGKLFK